LQWCFSNGKEKAKQLLDGVVSSMKDGEEMVDCSVLGVGRKKVLNSGVSASGKKSTVLSNGVSASEGERRNNCWTELFRR
jgi:hypothetical protein